MYLPNAQYCLFMLLVSCLKCPTLLHTAPQELKTNRCQLADDLLACFCPIFQRDTRISLNIHLTDMSSDMTANTNQIYI